ncbi:MAG: hypothetical protein II956_13410 [Bacteroidales bacterium]|nr:hypothetical protein [Bacteroidales bacterium]
MAVGTKIKRSYLICFNPYADDRDKILGILNKEGLKTWRTEISGCIMLKTVNSAKIVRDLLVDKMEGRFIVAEISGNRNGMMSQKGWDFLADSRNTEVVYDV